VLDLCRQKRLAFVPFFPLGSAFSGGPAKLASDPVVARIVERHDATPAQVALAWLLQNHERMLLIPGTSSVAHLEENMAAAGVRLDPEDVAALDAIAP
jgi:pyridoxine 4-dehydrogenase